MGQAAVTAHSERPGHPGCASGGDRLGEHACGAFPGARFPGAQPNPGHQRRGEVGADRGDQRGQSFSQDLLAGDFGVPVGGTLFGVSVHRA